MVRLPRIVRTLLTPYVAGGLLGACVSGGPLVLRAVAANPTLSVFGLGDQVTVEGVVPFEARASQAGLTDVQFWVGGQPLGPVITSGSCSVAWDTTSLPDGDATLYAIGHDDTGRQVTSAPVLVHVRNSTSSISNLRVVPDGLGLAAVEWQTALTGDGVVEFGATSTYGQSTVRSVALSTSHRVRVPVSPGNLIHFRVRSRDWQGVESLSGDRTFTAPLIVADAGCTGANGATAGSGACAQGGAVPADIGTPPPPVARPPGPR